MRLVTSLLGGLLFSAQAMAAQSSIAVSRPTVVAGDLASVRVMDPARAIVFRVYFDSTSRRTALATIPTLADMYAEIARLTGAQAAQVEWGAATFVHEQHYVSPRIGNEVRWPITCEADGTVGVQGTRDLFVTLPHEQVHSVQSSMVGQTPRWFSEGQAEWIGLQLTARYRPALGEQERTTYVEAAAKSQPHLRAWGGIQPKPEAILRQMTAEQRAHHERDPSYMPPGPWSFGPGDLVSDESQLIPRYGAALLVFEDLNRVAGAEAMSTWFQDLWAPADPLTTDALVRSAEQRFRMNLGARLQ